MARIMAKAKAKASVVAATRATGMTQYQRQAASKSTTTEKEAAETHLILIHSKRKVGLVHSPRIRIGAHGDQMISPTQKGTTQKEKSRPTPKEAQEMTKVKPTTSLTNPSQKPPCLMLKHS